MAYYVINYSKLCIWEQDDILGWGYPIPIQVYDNIDHLFDLPDGQFYAVMDCFYEKTWSHTPQYKIGYCQQYPDRVKWDEELGPKPHLYFNAGMFVFEPSLTTYYDLLQTLKIIPPTPFAEQGTSGHQLVLYILCFEKFVAFQFYQCKIIIMFYHEKCHYLDTVYKTTRKYLMILLSTLVHRGALSCVLGCIMRGLYDPLLCTEGLRAVYKGAYFRGLWDPLSYTDGPWAVYGSAQLDYARMTRYGDFTRSALDIYKPIPNIYNLVLAMLWRHPENVKLDQVKIVHYCTAGPKPWRYTGKEEHMDREDIKMLVKKWWDIYNNEALDYIATAPSVAAAAGGQVAEAKLTAALTEAGVIHFIPAPSAA
ncbi:Hexosyltransferase [Forsythia ovata]|uniref:Hexosyltransferase n=1 Tax=Forsythia ovata TaxID=205694 RepID=A0ABD1PYQ0_9LAMI